MSNSIANGGGASSARELPIIFTGTDPAKIRAGTKTQTRRIIKSRKCRHFGCELAACEIAGEIKAGDYRNAMYQPGMRLWVREAWRRDIFDDTKTIYRATHGDRTVFDKWLPSIHMPRTRCRTLLEVVSVRAERLQDISEADAVAEGFLSGAYLLSACDQFAGEWERIQGRGSWALNPVVEAIEFKVVS